MHSRRGRQPSARGGLSSTSRALPIWRRTSSRRCSPLLSCAMSHSSSALVRTTFTFIPAADAAAGASSSSSSSSCSSTWPMLLSSSSSSLSSGATLSPWPCRRRRISRCCCCVDALFRQLPMAPIDKVVGARVALVVSRAPRFC
ncbi:hypothetical protein D1007_35928 [Hordeum vulgare]|nr:hypothetical protein D1007_35928 [Hordeum vulgare]